MPELDLTGRTLGRYQIISPLGSGGMAVVYRARQTDLDRIVALKILPPELSLDKSYIARFMQEARSAAALEHPHIVPIFDVGTAEGLHFISMKYIQGETLKDLALRSGALDIARTAALVEQVAGALDYAHSNGIIHRDIKPSNMMVDRGGWVYLTDFGLARGGAGGAGLTMAGTVMGTPEYMSPEQAQGLATIGPPSDIYALGVVLYELLTGRIPFQADTPMGMLIARLQHAPTPPRDYRGDLPLPVEDVLMRALARRPESRFASATELIAALKRAAGLGSQPNIGPERPAETPHRGVSGTGPAQYTPQTPLPTAAGMAAPRSQTPPPVPVRVSEPVATPQRMSLPPAAATVISPSTQPTPTPNAIDRPRSRKGLMIGIGVVLALVLAGGGYTIISRQSGEAAVTEQLNAAQAAFDRPGGFDDAIAGYQRALELSPDQADAQARIALIYLLRDRNADAQAAAEQAIENDDENALAHAVLAEALNAQGQYDEALEASEQAVSLDDEFPAGYAVRAIIKADRAAKITDQSLLDEALSDAEQAIQLAGNHENLFQAMAHNTRGFVYWQQYLISGESSAADRGGDEFNRAIGLQPQIAVFHSNLGYFYNAQGSRALDRGDEQDAQSKLDLARAQFEHAQEADADYGHAHAGLGWNLFYLKDYAGALGEFQKAIELNSLDSDALIGQSRVYLDQPEPDYAAAIDALTQAGDVAPHDPIVFSSLGWAYMNQAFSQADDTDAEKASYSEAETSFRTALALNDRSADALTGIGWALRGRAVAEADDDLFDEAIASLEQAVEIDPEHVDAYFGLGWTNYGRGNYAEAEQPFRQAIELRPDDHGNYYWLGLTLQQLGRADEARAAYETALAKGSPYAQEALDSLK